MGTTQTLAGLAEPHQDPHRERREVQRPSTRAPPSPTPPPVKHDGRPTRGTTIYPRVQQTSEHWHVSERVTYVSHHAVRRTDRGSVHQDHAGNAELSPRHGCALRRRAHRRLRPREPRSELRNLVDMITEWARRMKFARSRRSGTRHFSPTIPNGWHPS